MNTEELEHLQDIVRKWASTVPYRIKVYAFGSRVKGTARPDSDLDLALEVLDNQDAWLLWFGVHENWQRNLSKITGLKVHLELYEEDESPVLKNSLNEASVLLFEPQEQP
jgi:predicted nucleotidyltransferase